MKIEQVDITAIKPYEKNPRKNDRAVDVVANSLEQYGFQQPIVVDKNMTIIVGHTRYKAAKTLNFKQVPVLIAMELNEEQCQAYRIMDNRSSENARWDEDLLFKELEELLNDNDITGLSYDTGMSEAELNKLFADKTDPLDEIQSQDNTISKKGDLWILGRHRLLNGDSTKPEDVQSLMKDDLVDLIWEDPPYGVSWSGAQGEGYKKRDFTIKNDNLTEEELDQFIINHLDAIDPYVKLGSVIYIAHDIRYNYQWKKIFGNKNYNINSTLIWDKKGYSEASKFLNYRKAYEPILYGWKKGAEHKWFGIASIDIMTPEELEDYSKEQLIKLVNKLQETKDIIQVPREKKEIAKLHPTVKPVKLIINHILNSSQPNDIIYDGFAGSGSTLLAAEQTHRQARCIEYEAKFVDVIIKRWQELTGQQAQRQDGVLWDDIIPEEDTTKLENFFNMETNNGS